MLALAPPLSHTQWDRNKAAGRLYSLGSTPAGPEGGEPDAGVPFQGLSLVSGNPGVQRCRGLRCSSCGVGSGRVGNQRVRKAPLRRLTGEAVHLALAGHTLRAWAESEHCVSRKG